MIEGHNQLNDNRKERKPQPAPDPAIKAEDLGRPRPEFCQHPRPPRYVVNSDTAVPCVRDTRRNKDLELADVVEILNDYGYDDREGNK
jgi:hypothetical protein